MTEHRTPPSGLVLTATDNPTIKAAIALHEPRERRDQSRFLAEGRRSIDGLLAAGWVPELLFVRDGAEVPAHWPAVVRVGERVAARLSQLSTAPGYAGIFPLPVPPPLDVHAGGLILAGISDPGNLGTLLRAAAAFACRQVVLAGGADPFSSKVLQASAGALPLVHLHPHIEPGAMAGGAPLCALVVSGGVPPGALPPGPRWLVVGGEAHGVPPEWLAQCREQLTLPMPGGTESLNAAMAGTVALYAVHCPVARTAG